MKKVILIAMVFLGISTTKGYSQDTAKTIFHVSKINSIGFYVAPEYQYGQLKNQFTGFGGISGMILLNKTFAIGGGMYGSMDRGFSPTGISPLVLHSRFGGLKMEYTLNPNSVVHISFPLMIGGGSANTDSANYVVRPNNRDSAGRRVLPGTFQPRKPGNDFFLIQPGVQVEANLFRSVKLFAGANYRFVVADKLTNLPMNTMQGFSASLGLKIGLFNIPVRKSIQ